MCWDTPYIPPTVINTSSCVVDICVYFDTRYTYAQLSQPTKFFCRCKWGLAMTDGGMAVDELEDGDDSPLYECLTGAVEIKVNVSSKKHQIFVSPSEIKVIPEGTFIRIDVKKSNIRSLLTVLCDAKRSDVHKVMNCTNVVHNIACVKTDHRRKSAESKMTKAGYHRCRSKKSNLAVMLMQPVQTIRSPDVNTVPGIEMRVLTTRATGKGSGLWVELLSVNLENIARQMAAQYTAGGVTKEKNRKVDHDHDDRVQSDEDADDGEELAQSVGSAGDSQDLPTVASSPSSSPVMAAPSVTRQTTLNFLSVPTNLGHQVFSS